MKIAKDTAVTVSMRVTDTKGMTIDDGKQPVAYLHGGYDGIFAKLEAALDGQEAGFETRLALGVEDCFGEYDEALLQTMPKAEFPAGIKVGGQIQRQDAKGELRYFFVTKIKGPTVMLDGNHPLAGKAMNFVVKVLDVRAATDEEIAHQHVHGAHGHHH